MGRNVTLFVTGIVTIGIITALVMPGRKTADVVNAGGTASSKLLATAIKGS